MEPASPDGCLHYSLCTTIPSPKSIRKGGGGCTQACLHLQPMFCIRSQKVLLEKIIVIIFVMDENVIQKGYLLERFKGLFFVYF